MIVRDKSFKVFGPVHLRVHLGQGVFLPEGGWTVEVNTEGEKGTAGRRGLCTHRPTGCWSPQSSLRAASSPGRQGSCVRAGRRHGPLNAKCWSPQSSERAASSPGRQGSRARASSRQGSPRPTLRPCKRAPTPAAPWGWPAPPPTAPCACAPLAAPPPAGMPCCRPPAYHFPHRCPTRPPRPACDRSLPMRPYASADTALHRAAARAPPHRRASVRGRHADARMRPTSHTAARPRSRPASLAAPAIPVGAESSHRMSRT